MTDAEPLCQQCHRPSPHGYLCPTCTTVATADVERLGWLAGQCRDQATALRSPGYEPRSTGTPHVHTAPQLAGRDLARVLDTARDTYTGWVWAEDPNALTTWRNVRGLIGDALRCINPRAPRWYVGPCDTTGATPSPLTGDLSPCWADLWVRPGARDVQCQVCARSHDVPTRRTHLLAVLEDQWATEVDLISAAPTLLGEALARGRFAVWRSRGLEVRGVDGAGRRLYRVGDVVDRLERAATNRMVAAP